MSSKTTYRGTPYDVKRYLEKMDNQRKPKRPSLEATLKRLRNTEKKLKATEKRLKKVKEEFNRKTPRVKQVTPVAQAIEIAKSQVKQAGRETQRS